MAPPRAVSLKLPKSPDLTSATASGSPWIRIHRIPDRDDTATIEPVRGRLDRQRADELLRFWLERGALSGLEARRRLPEVVCLVRLGGSLVGSSSAYAATLAPIGERRFWVLRYLLDEVVADQAPALIRAAFEVLAADFDGAAGSPIGLCVLAGPELRRQRPEAEWTDPRMIYAGYLPEGLQLRIAYFDGAVIT